jgi:hypothetical protein
MFKFRIKRIFPVMPAQRHPPSAWGLTLSGKALGVVADGSQVLNENRFHALPS